MHRVKTAADAAGIYGAAGGSSPLADLVQVHDGMIAKLAEARRAIADGRIEDRLNATLKVATVLDLLQMSLDHERGGDVARNLDQLYLYFGKRLLDINVRNDPAICDELIERFAELREGWRGLTRQDVTTPPPAAPAASISA